MELEELADPLGTAVDPLDLVVDPDPTPEWVDAYEL